MKKIIGFIPTPTQNFGFGIPIYGDHDNELYFHKLDKESKIIIDFEHFEGRPIQMIYLPEQFHEVLSIGSQAIFVISGKNEIFVGNRDDLKPYYKAIISKAGEHFIKELKSMLKI
ncbi:MAG: hypothetical protein WC564_03215 [Patescibacteria group bacterium]|jgi:hypothetical protein